jgi:hypothetical protein
MTITLHLGSWLVPASMSLLAVVMLLWAYAVDRRASGYTQGVLCFLALCVCIPLVIAAWVVFFVMALASGGKV